MAGLIQPSLSYAMADTRKIDDRTTVVLYACPSILNTEFSRVIPDENTDNKETVTTYHLPDLHGSYIVWLEYTSNHDHGQMITVNKTMVVTPDTVSTDNVYKWLPCGSVDFGPGQHYLIISFIPNYTHLRRIQLSPF